MQEQKMVLRQRLMEQMESAYQCFLNQARQEETK